MPPILENSTEDEVTIAMVEFEKKRSLKRYSRYGSTVSQDEEENNKLASTLLKTVDNNVHGNEENLDYNNLANKMVCAKRIQYAAGFITLISIIIVLILTTIKSGDSPNLAPHSPQHGHSSKSSPSSLGFDAATGDYNSNINNNNDENNIIDENDNIINENINKIINDDIIDLDSQNNVNNNDNNENNINANEKVEEEVNKNKNKNDITNIRDDYLTDPLGDALDDDLWDDNEINMDDADFSDDFGFLADRYDDDIDNI